MTAWEGPDGSWLQSLSVDFSNLAASGGTAHIPDNVAACNEEIAALREKSGHLKRKVRRAAEEEANEHARIAALELEVAALEDQLARKIHELG